MDAADGSRPGPDALEAGRRLLTAPASPYGLLVPAAVSVVLITVEVASDASRGLVSAARRWVTRGAPPTVSP